MPSQVSFQTEPEEVKHQSKSSKVQALLAARKNKQISSITSKWAKKIEEVQLPFTEQRIGNTIILNPRSEHKHTLIWLHGLGDTPEHFKSVFLNAKQNRGIILPPGTKVVMPTAPQRPVLGSSMDDLINSWYKYLDVDDEQAYPESITPAWQSSTFCQSSLGESANVIAGLVKQEA